MPWRQESVDRFCRPNPITRPPGTKPWRFFFERMMTMDNGRSPSVRYMTDDLRIKEIKELSPPSHLIREFPCSDRASQTVHDARNAVHRVLHGMDDRLVVVIGPCSLHAPA